MIRKLLSVVSACCLSSLLCYGQITLGSRHVVYDNLTGNWLCSIPESAFGNDFSATFGTSEPWSDITLDGEPVIPGSEVTFAQVSGDRQYHLLAHVGDSITISGNISFTFYPIFELTGTFTDDYQVTSIVANMPENQGPTTMFSKIKRRGGITNQDPREKRNYHIKFLKPDSSKMDRKFFGLRNDNSWILDAGQIDMLRIRNRVSTELWLDMCRPPYYADREPKALSGVRGDFIEVFLNGKYNGIYALTEALDRKQLKLAKYDETEGVPDPFHGLLWKVTAIDNVTRMRNYYGYNNNAANWSSFEVKYPDPDDVLPTHYGTLADAVRFVAKSSNEEFCAHVGEYFDLPVIMDYWIFINAIMGVDNGIKNIYWATYDRQQDKKLTIAAWDLDCTFGQNWINQPLHNEAVVGATRQLSSFNHLFMRLHELSPDSFSIKAVERYQQLRQTVLSEDSLKNRFRARLEPLYRSGAVARETARWSRVIDLSHQPLDFPAEMAYIENWIDQRMPFLDQSRFMPYTLGDTNRDGMVDVTDVNVLITLVLTDDYPVWYQDMNGDGAVDVTDINMLVTMILGTPQNPTEE